MFVILYVVGCIKHIRYSLFFSCMEDLSLSDNHGSRFRYCVLARVTGNDSSYVFKEFWDLWLATSEKVQRCPVFFPFILTFIRVSLMMRVVLYSSVVRYIQCLFDIWTIEKLSVISVVRTPLWIIFYAVLNGINIINESASILGNSSRSIDNWNQRNGDGAYNV